MNDGVNEFWVLESFKVMSKSFFFKNKYKWTIVLVPTS